MTIDSIRRIVQSLVKDAPMVEPAALAQALDILVRPFPLGMKEDACKGFFIIHRRQKHITYNSDLPVPLQRVVLAHELGHAVLHSDGLGPTSFHDVLLFSSPDEKEYEANLFAAELLLPDTFILPKLSAGRDFFALSQALEVPAPILDFKLRILRHEGHPVSLPLSATGNFLKAL